MKRKIIVAALLLILATLGALWLGASRFGHASALAAEQLEELRTKDLPALAQDDTLEPEALQFFQCVLDDFYRTQDPRRTMPGTRVGLLHLACLFKKQELARCLLLDGADPNAHGEGEDSPLLLAVGTGLFPQATPQELNALVDTLLDAGASFAKSGRSSADFLTQAALLCEREDTLLHLMSRGARPDADTAMPLALHGWPRALAAVLKEQGQTGGLMHAVARGACLFDGSYVECLELLQAHGADAGASEEGAPGSTPLYLLAREMANLSESDPHRPQAVEALLWLLAHGADAYLRCEGDEEYPGFCPYDFLASNPDLLVELRARGQSLPPPTLRFSSGPALLPEVCREAMRPHPAEQLAPHFESIAALLAPTAEMQRHEMYPQALAAAIGLLARIDPARAAQSIQAMPLWLLEAAPHTGEEEEDALAALARALQDTAGLVLPRGFICTQAERLLAQGRPEEAATLTELLARCADAQEEINRYCADARLPLQAGGYAAKLYAAGLPDARNNGVAAWLLERRRQADTPFLQEAVLLTSLERLWYGQMPPEQQQEMLRLMRHIGATAAAAAYEQIIRCLDKPEELDAIMAQGDSWKYELEAATARYFLANKDQFLTHETQP